VVCLFIRKFRALPREARLLLAGCLLFPRSEAASEELQDVVLENEKKQARKKGRRKEE
jgi:hypothetical protein